MSLRGPGFFALGFELRCWAGFVESRAVPRGRKIALPPPPQASLPCPWCPRRSGPSCPSCHRRLHFKGECRWNRGAHPHPAFRSPADAPQLCPDCCWVWCRALIALPTRHADPLPPTAELTAHLQAIAAACLPGAGSASTPASALSLRSVRRWLLRHLRTHGPASLDDLLPALCAWAPDSAADWHLSVLRRAARALQAEGRISFSNQHLRLLGQS